MLDVLSILPLGFWFVALLLGIGTVWAVKQMRTGLGLPVLVALGTVASWYVVDAFYNNYFLYEWQFTSDVRDAAWWQVAFFLCIFLLLAPLVNHWINGPPLRRSSQILAIFKNGTGHPQFQSELQLLFKGCVFVWVVLSIVAIIRLRGESINYFYPFLSYRADPWSRERIGSGFDSILSLAGYLELFLAAMFGILSAMLNNSWMRRLSLLILLHTWPYFVFDRTRNTMLAAILPGILAWVLLRLRWHILIKILLLALFFCVINAWFGFVIAHRSDIGITSALQDEGFDAEKNSRVHHEGLNMFQELCWANTFIDERAYEPNWGYNYLAELVNPIPRTLWPDKPTIGLDYALLRGQSYDEGQGGVGATISTGLIGQGVLNFGEFLGPGFAACLLSLWVALLARLDLQKGPGPLCLYGVGLILTFNLGRDITLLTLYTFVFGYVFVWLIQRIAKSRMKNLKAPKVPRSSPAHAAQPT